MSHTPCLKCEVRVTPGQDPLRSDNCLFIICAIPVQAAPPLMVTVGAVDPADQPQFESTMVLTLPLVELPTGHPCMASPASNGPRGIASLSAFKGGAPPGVPVSRLPSA